MGHPADRQLYLGTLAGYFRDEVVRWLLHGNSLLLLQRTCSSHLWLLILTASALNERIGLKSTVDPKAAANR
jgi:hypothetical protein